MYSIIRSICLFTLIAIFAAAHTRADVNASLSLLRAVEDQPQPALAPTSVLDMIGLLYYGSAGSSERQLSALFGGVSREDVAKQAAKAQRNLPGYSRIGSVWFSERVQVTNEYYQAISDQWNFHVSIAPLRTDPSTAAQDVNFWYSQLTNGHIKNVIQPSDLNGQPDMLAVVATAFISPWKTPFDPGKTRNATFYRSSEQKFPVKMMQETAKYPYFEDDAFQVLSIPLKMDDFAMYFLLPRDARDFDASMKKLNGDYLENAVGKAKPSLVKVDLPRVSFKVKRDWRDVFVKSKLSAPFTKDQANFERINNNKPEPLFIAKLIEEVEIKWDEAGVMARSVTSAVSDPVASKPEAKFTFNANHPFVFVIYNKKDKDVAFAGIIEAPEQMQATGQ